MKNNGWIKIHRKILDKGWWQNSKYVHLWVHILLKANHEEKEFMFNGSIHKIKRGEFITGRMALVRETGISATTIERILDLFEKEGQIGQQKNNRFRRISVLNYEKFQDHGHQTDIQRTSSGHPADTNKNYKNYKNDNYTAEKISADKYSNPPEGKMNCKEFVEWFKKSKERYKNIIADWAETCEPNFRTKAQWEVWAKSQYSIAKELAPFDDEDFIEAYDQISKSEKIKTFNLRTLKYFVVNIKK